MKHINLTGHRFGKMTVLQQSHTDGHRTFWVCRCDCGKQFVRSADNITSRKDRVQSCGCYRPNRVDLTGQRFGKIVVVSEESAKGRNGEVNWLCQCDCGNKTVRTTGNLQSNKNRIQSCGCFVVENARRKVPLANQSRMLDLTGQRFGRLIVIRKTGMNPDGQSVWLCQCDCGNQIERKIGALHSNRAKLASQSCGCFSKERIQEIGRKRGLRGWMIGIIHGYGPNWKQQRAAARARDHYTCQECGKNENGKVFDVHHIRPFKDFDSWQEANRLENLITLCQKCHLKQNPR